MKFKETPQRPQMSTQTMVRSESNNKTPPRGADKASTINLGTPEELRGNISEDEMAFALREWRTLIRRVRDYEQRYGFKLEES